MIYSYDFELSRIQNLEAIEVLTQPTVRYEIPLSEVVGRRVYVLLFLGVYIAHRLSVEESYVVHSVQPSMERKRTTPTV